MRLAACLPVVLVLSCCLAFAADRGGMLQEAGQPQQSPSSSGSGLAPNRTEMEVNGQPAVLYYDRLLTPAPKVLEAQGRVHLQFGEFLLWCERATYNQETGQIEAEESVRIVHGIQELRCQRAEYNLKTGLGNFTEVNGHTDEELIFHAQRVEKTGENLFRMENGFVTACRDAVPKWSLSVERGTLELKKTIRISHSIFRLKNIPVFYFPFVRLPAGKKSRSSGFLLPSTGSSNAKGRSVSDSFYFTLGPSADLLVNMEYFSKRGAGYGFAFRAKPNRSSHMNISYFFVNDRLNQGGGNLIADAEMDFGNNLRGVAALNLVTNFAYRQNFSDNFLTATNPIDLSVAFLTKNSGSYGFNVLLSRQETFFPEHSVLIRNAPGSDFHIFGHKWKSLPIYFYLDSSLDLLMREDLYMNTPDFVPRFDFRPRVSFPLKKWTGLSITPRLSWQHTTYSDRFSSDSSGTLDPKNLYRNSYTIELDFKAPQIERYFRISEGRQRIHHTIEPSVLYRKIGGLSGAPSTLLFDESDILRNTSELEYGITQRLFLRKPGPAESSAAELLSWRLFQQYYFDPTFGGLEQITPTLPSASFLRLTSFPMFDGKNPRRFSPVVSSLRASPSPGVYTDFLVEYDTLRQRVRAAGVTGSAAIWKIYTSWTVFGHKKIGTEVLPTGGDLQPEEIRFLTDKSLQFQSQLGYGNPQKGFSASLTVSYDVQRSTLMNSHSRLFYNWDCCGVALDFLQFDTGFRNETQIRFAFSLKGLGYFGNIRRPERLF